MRLRILFSKSGGLRYTGHLDLHSTWERTVRRAGLPLAYTQGFHPGPRLQIASALPLGFIGRAEIVDVWLDETRLEAGPWDFRKALQSGAPPGLDILS
ncbi:MAG TPA: TIGR03936 family radical SAM-associated protein, partial [Anaerolineales bacterium]|nr:TIGR03936 family radical SAM-associated protein [Anaerolineales bacterium]